MYYNVVNTWPCSCVRNIALHFASGWFKQSLSFIENGLKKKISSEQECLIHGRGQRRMVRLIDADRKATVTEEISLAAKVCRRAPLNVPHIKP